MTVEGITGKPDGDLIESVVWRYGGRRDTLVQMLRDVQAQTYWLSPEIMQGLARALGLTPAIVEGVASFYRFFHLKPVAPYHFLWSDNITDRMLGSRKLATQMAGLLGVEPGASATERDLATMNFTSCTGLGDQGPALLVNQHQVLTRMSAERVGEVVDLVRAGVPVTAWPVQWQSVDDQIRRIDRLLSSSAVPGDALRATVQRGPEATLAELDSSRLRGRGGAGFPVASKWRACLQSPCLPGKTRVVICNADEGEPGTFKDRVLMTQQAHTLFEGMTIAAHVLGASTGLVYLRGEYRYLLEGLLACLQERRQKGLLGRNILGVDGFDFDIDIHLGAGAYVCGEESALIESLEGKRGTPRIRPPYPVECGYMGQPTVVNNVETFCAVVRVAERGGADWANIGTAESTGTKLHSVSGDCARPGIYEYPFGVSIEQILDDCGAREHGRQVQAVQVGGPSGICLAAEEFIRTIGFEDVPTAGAFMVFDQTRDMFEVARCFAHFFAHESCGFCTPCRVGTELLVRRMDKLSAGHGSLFDEAELHELESLLHGTTHCALGATATNPLRDTLQRFRPAYENRLQFRKFQPGFDLDAELASARAVTGRDDAEAHLSWEE